MTQLYHVFYRFLDLLFPPRCVNCDTYLNEDLALCRNCRAKIVLQKTFFCGKCRGRIPPGLLRSGCHPYFPYVLGAATDYGEEIPRRLVLALKFQRIKSAARDLASLMEIYLLNSKFSILNSHSVLVPIPLGSRRERERGYNQAELIAKELSLEYAIPLVPDALRRIRNTKPQSKLLDHDQRKANMLGSFTADPQKLRGVENVILVDDVTTSGATFKVAALAIKAVANVNIIALAAAKA